MYLLGNSYEPVESVGQPGGLAILLATAIESPHSLGSPKAQGANDEALPFHFPDERVVGCADEL